MPQRQTTRTQAALTYAAIIALVVVLGILVVIMIGPRQNICFCGPVRYPTATPTGAPTALPTITSVSTQ
jgi:hypothetical protein